MERFDELLAGYLEGDLSPAETAELAALIENDATLRQRFLDLAGMDGLIRARLTSADAEDALLRRISMVLVEPGHEERTAAGVMERIEDRKRHTPRRLRAVRLRQSSSSSGLAWGLAAAAALVFIGFLAFSSSTPEPKAVPIVRTPEPLPPIPPAPAPRIETPRPAPIQPLPPPPKPDPLPPPPPPVPAPAPPPPPAPEPSKPRPTLTAIAKLDQIHGTVEVLSEGRRLEARAGLDLLPSQGLETAADGRASIVFVDGTRLEIHSGSTVREFDDQNRVTVGRGTVSADVKPQPAGRPFVLRSDQAEATVLGTRLLLTVGPAATRLEVTTGRVRLTRREDNASVEVPAGKEAVAARGTPLVATPIMAVVSFTLINTDTNKPIAGYDPIPEGATITLAKLPSRRLNIRANTTSAAIGCVQFGFDDNPEYNTEREAPFGLVTASVQEWTPASGPHAVTATPFSGPPSAGKRTGTGTAGRSLTLRFTIK